MVNVRSLSSEHSNDSETVDDGENELGVGDYICTWRMHTLVEFVSIVPFANINGRSS